MQRSSFKALDPYPRFGTPLTTLRGALALLFDRAAALFGTKAAAAERHRATMRRCIFKIARRAAILPSYVLCFLPVVRARAPDPNCVEGMGRSETSLKGSRSVLYCVVPTTTPPAAVACQTRPRARGRDGQ